MKTPPRRTIGIALAVLAIAAVVILAAAGVPLVSHNRIVHGSLPGPTVVDEFTKIHWALVPPALAFMVGALLIALSRHDNAA